MSTYSFNQSWYYILPEISLLFFIILGLIIVGMANFQPQATIIEKKKKITPIIVWISLYGLFFTLIIMYLLSSNLNNGKVCFNSYIIVDIYSTMLKFGLLITMFVLLISSFWYIAGHTRPLMEFPVLLLLTTFCLFVLLSAYDLIVMFVAIIAFSLNIYVLLLTDFMNKSSREASVKYYYLSTLSSGLIIGGILIAYLVFHTTNFLNITWIIHNWYLNDDLKSHAILLTIMLYFMITGFLFKLSAFPGHFWTPEVYDGAPHPITAIFILPIKIATFGIFLRLLSYVFHELHFLWSFILIISSGMSMIVGALLALVEFRIKRFIAYSSINQMGFMLIGIIAGTFEALRASLIFLFIYILMNLGIFILFLNTRDEKTNRSLTYITDLKNFAAQNHLVTVPFVVILFSMAGIPPLAGFFGKFYLLLHAFEEQQYLLVIIGLVTSLISAYYYLRLIKLMWFDTPENIETNPLIQINFITFFTNHLEQILYLVEGLLVSFIIWQSFFFPILNLITYSCVMPLSNIPL